MPETITLPVYCAYCGRPVTLLCRPEPDRAPRIWMWSCPYRDCRKDKLNHVPGLVGKIVDQWPGHGPDPLVDERVH